MAKKKSESSEEETNIIHKDGRKPYDENEPRFAEGDHVNRDVPDDYVSIQQQINSGPGKTINMKVLLGYLDTLRNRGFVKIEPNLISEVPIGCRFAYISNENKWRSGGFLVSHNTSDSAYDPELGIVDGVYEEKRPFLMYKGFNNAVYSLQVDDVFEFWYLPRVDPKVFKKKQNEKRAKKNASKIVILRKPLFSTDFPVTLLDNNGTEVTVFFGRDNTHRNRFANSNKYLKALENGWTFEDGTQIPGRIILVGEDSDSE